MLYFTGAVRDAPLVDERPETVQVGANVIAGCYPADILVHARKMIECKRTWKNPFGDGRASERILRIIENNSQS